MRATGIVKWFDRESGLGEVALDDGECVAVRRDVVGRAPEADSAPEGGRARHDTAPLDVVAAYRAGTWGDGGRDY